jgi:hypothetical protein
VLLLEIKSEPAGRFVLSFGGSTPTIRQTASMFERTSGNTPVARCSKVASQCSMNPSVGAPSARAIPLRTSLCPDTVKFETRVPKKSKITARKGFILCAGVENILPDPRIKERVQPLVVLEDVCPQSALTDEAGLFQNSRRWRILCERLGIDALQSRVSKAQRVSATTASDIIPRPQYARRANSRVPPSCGGRHDQSAVRCNR